VAGSQLLGLIEDVCVDADLLDDSLKQLNAELEL
jgi:hypothetical protein